MLGRDQTHTDLIYYFPKWKHIKKESHAYWQLVLAFCNYVDSNYEERDERREELRVCFESFNHLCDTDPDCVEEKKRFDLEEAVQKRDDQLKSLYLKEKSIENNLYGKNNLEHTNQDGKRG